MEDKAKNTVDSFYHKELEEITEYICVFYLYRYRDKFATILLNEKREQSKKDYAPFTSKIKDFLEKVANRGGEKFADLDNPEKEYESAAEVLAYRDANSLVEVKISTGDLISKDNGEKITYEEKIDICIDFLRDNSEINDDVEEGGKGIEKAPNCCTLWKDCMGETCRTTCNGIKKCTIF